MGRLRAVYDYSAQEDNELGLKEDEIITLLCKLDADWWLVRNDLEEYGLVPSNYVETLIEGIEDDVVNGEGNIFESVNQQSAPAALMSFKEAFPNASISKKYQGELLNSSKDKIKGKLIVFNDDQVVFVKGKEKLIEFHHPLSFFHDFDRASGLLSGKNQSYYLTLGKNDAKDLEVFIKRNSSNVPAAAVFEQIPLAAEVDEARKNVPCLTTTEEQDNQEYYADMVTEMHASGSEEQNGITEIADLMIKSALYDYEPQDQEEVGLEEGEQVEIIAATSEDWWRVRKVSSGEEGLVPKNYLVDEGHPDDDKDMCGDANFSCKTQLSEVNREKVLSGVPEEQQETNIPSAGMTRKPLFLAEIEQRGKLESGLELMPQISRTTNQHGDNVSPKTTLMAPPPPPPLPSRPAEGRPKSIEISAPPPPIPQRPEPVNIGLPSPKSNTQSRGDVDSKEEVDAIDPLEELKKKMEKKMESIKAAELSSSPSFHKIQSHGPTQLKSISRKEAPPTTTAAIPPKSNPWSSVSLNKPSTVKAPIPSMATFNAPNSQKTLPNRPDKTQSLNKPNPGETRLWKDQSGSFQTEASFVSYESGKVTIHKLNGNKISVPLNSLSDRDVEFVRRKCKLTSLPSSVAKSPPTPGMSSAVSATGPKPPGFDWSLLLMEAGLPAARAGELHQKFADRKLNENWLETVNRDRLISLGVLSDGECLMIMQIITKRRLQRLEKLGQEKILESIKNTHIRPQVGFAPSIQSLKPTPVTSMPLAPQWQNPSIADITNYGKLPHHSFPVSDFASPANPPPAMPQTSLKDIPTLQPRSNSLNSVKMETKPAVNNYSTSTTIPIANSPYMAQQYTTTQYVASRSTTSKAADGQPGTTDPYQPNATHPYAQSIPPMNQPQQRLVDPLGFSARPVATNSNQPGPYTTSQFTAPPSGYTAATINNGYSQPMLCLGPNQAPPSLNLAYGQSPQTPSFTQGYGQQPQRVGQNYGQSMMGNALPVAGYAPNMTPIPMMPPLQQHQQQQTGPVDKYSIFKQVDPNAPGLITTTFPPQAQPQQSTQQSGQPTFCYANTGQQWRPGPSY